MKTMLCKALLEDVLPDFQALWNHRPVHPENRMVIVRDKETGEYKEKTIFRYFQAYLRVPGFDDTTGKSYMFSGSRDPRENYVFLPECLKQLAAAMPEYDSCMVNWYEPEDYIEMHSDCTAKLDPNSDIVMINLNEPDTEADRFFRTEKNGIVHDIPLEDGVCIGRLIKYWLEY